MEVGATALVWSEIRRDRTLRGWEHTGVCCLPDGTVVSGRPDGGALSLYDPSGTLISTVDLPLTETHGIYPAPTAGSTAVWIADNGHRFVPSAGHYDDHILRGRVALVSLAGRVLKELAQPEHEAYEQAQWMPCAAVTDDPDLGGDGDIWVADGYGQNLLHRFDADGTYISTFDGAAGSPWDTPHALFVDRRGSQPEMYVADRGNHRIVVLDLEGGTQRTFGEDVLTSPSGLVVSHGLLAVTDLFGCVVFFDRDDQFVGSIGGPPMLERDDAWPNVERGDEIVRAPMTPGEFRSPHGIAADLDGNLYVTEWLIGGRLTRLAVA